MRRIALIVALVAALAWIGPPARAHFCTNPVEVDPGRPATITVGVAAEEVGLTEVDINVPDGFRVSAAVDTAGWTSALLPDVVRFTGGPIQPFTCGFFSITGVATRKATLVFPITVKRSDGAIRKYTSTRPFDPSGAQLVYAGTTPPGADGGSGDGSGAGTAMVVVVAVVVGLAIAVFALRSALAHSPGTSASRRRPARRSGRLPRRRSRAR